MKKLQPQTADAKAIGTTARAMLRSINLDNFQHILEKHDITVIQPDNWYPHQLLLDVLREIRDNEDAMYDLVSIGMQVVDRDGPRLRSSLRELLFALAELDQMQHQNSPRSYVTTEIDEQCIQVRDYTPWPHDLVFGMLWQIARVYDDAAKVERTGIEFDAAHGDEVGIYKVCW